MIRHKVGPHDGRTLTHLYKSGLRCFFRYLDSTSAPTESYSTRCASLPSGHAVRFDRETHSVPSRSSSCVANGHVQLATGQGTHLRRSADGHVSGEQRTHDLDCGNGEPFTSVSTIEIDILLFVL